MEQKENIEQTFVYLTNRCNIKCVTCYSIPNMKDETLSFEKTCERLVFYRAKGAYKLTLLGGEPTMYKNLNELIDFARTVGYTFVRINTNGMFNKKIFDKIINKIDVFCFSLDGHTEALNEIIRTGSTWNVILRNINEVRKIKPDVRVNCTVNSLNIDYIHDILFFFNKLEFNTVYLNVVFLLGEAELNRFLGVSPEQWLMLYNSILSDTHKYNFQLKIAKGFTHKSKLKIDQEAGHHCGALTQKKIYISSDKSEYPCLLFLGDVKRTVNEEYSHNLNHQYCGYLASLYKSEDGYLPLCIHYKEKIK